MSASLSPPPGFVMDQPQTAAGLPDGFVMDAAPAGQAHAMQGPTDAPILDWGRRLATAGLNAFTGAASMIPHTGVQIDPNTAKISADPVVTQDQKDQQAAANKDYVFNKTGVTEYVPQTAAGRVTQAALTAAPFAAMGGGILPTMAGGAAGQALTETGTLPPLAAALIGQVAGAKGANLATGAVGSMMPGAMDAGTKALAGTAINEYGINPTLAQVSNNPFVRYLDSTVQKMPFSGYGGTTEANQAAFNRGVASTFGEDAGKITPEVLNRAYDRIGGVMNDIASRTNVQMDQSLLNKLADIHQMAAEVGLDTGQANAVRGQIDKIMDIATNNGGVIPGDVYQNLTKKGESLDVLQGNRSTVTGNLGGQIRDALDEGLNRSAGPDDAAALQQARTQYKALKTVEPLTMRADAVGGPTPSTGDISPAALNARVNQQYQNAARAPLGQIPLKDLGQIGQRFLKEPPDSGTANREGIQSMIGHGGQLATAVGGAIAGHEMGAPLHITIPALATSLIAPRVIGSILRDPSRVNAAVNGASISPLAQIIASQAAMSPANPLQASSAPANTANSGQR